MPLRFRNACATAIGASAVWTFAAPLPPPPSTDDLPRVYDASAIREHWDAQPRRVARRCAEIVSSTAPLVSSFLWARFGPSSTGHIDDETKVALAIKLRDVLVKLGPTYIKFGQALSIRPDVMPPSAIAALQTLCDSCPAFDDATAMATMRDELGVEAFNALTWTDVDPRTGLPMPIAAASLGQVYRATALVNGCPVAVKVQRPDMVGAVSLDLHILRGVAAVADWLQSRLTAHQPYHADVLHTFAEASYRELDYEHEGRNQERFASLIAAKLGDAVHVPDVYWSHVSRRVLTTGWVEGTKLSSCDSDTINSLVNVGVHCFLVQLLELGFFHCDPHPGNLLVRKHPRTGEQQLVLIDFGLCAEVPTLQTKTMVKALIALFRNEIPELIEHAIVLGFLPHSLPVKERAALAPVLATVVSRGLLTAGSDMAARKARFSTMTKELNQIFFEFPFSIPPYFALITRALVTLEGIALAGDPAFDLFDSARPYVSKRALELGMRGELGVTVAEIHHVRTLLRL